MKIISIKAKSHVYEDLQKVFPKKTPQWISSKLNDYIVCLENQVTFSIANNTSQKLPIYQISTNILRKAVGVVGNPPKRVCIHTEIMKVCPLFKIEKIIFKELTEITLNTNNLEIDIATKQQIVDAITYTGINMNQTQANRLLGRERTNELVNGLFPDLYTNTEDYQLVRINLKSIRAYSNWISSPDYQHRSKADEIVACKILIEIGEFFPYHDANKHPDYTEYGILPVKKFKSDFGREYYQSSISNLNPQAMRKEFRKAVLGDETTYDYDMQAFAITWMYGVTKEFIESKGITSQSELPMSEIIANGSRSAIIDEIITTIFVDRLVTETDIKEFYYSQDWKYKKGESNEYIIKEGNLYASKDYFKKLMKRAFNAIGFGATAGNKCWVKEVKGKKVFHGTALREAFHGDKFVTEAFVSHPLVQQFFSEMKDMTDIIMLVKKADYIHLSSNEDFCSTTGKWNTNKVMAFLYQHAEYTIMEDIRAIIALYQDKGWYDGIVLCNIHDGLVLSHHDAEMIQTINDEIRREYNNPCLTLVATQYKGYNSSFFKDKEEELYHKRKKEEEKKAKNYISNFVTTTPIEVVPTMEQMLIDFYKHQEEEQQ